MKQILIVGCPRSGTTLLQALLSSHKEVASIPETHFFPSLCSKFGFVRFLGLSTANARNNLSFLSNKFLEKNIKPSFFSKTIVCQFLTFFDEYAKLCNCSAWLEKTPQNLWFLKFIKKYKKDFKIVHIERDPRDTIASIYDACKKYPHSWGYKSIEEIVTLWKQSKTLNDYWRNDPLHYFCKYEEICSNQDKEIYKILDFISIKSNEFTPHLNVADTLIEDSEVWKSGVKDSVSLAESKFKKVFTVSEQDLVDRLIKL